MEETRLAMISVPESNFFSKRHGRPIDVKQEVEQFGAMGSNVERCGAMWSDVGLTTTMWSDVERCGTGGTYLMGF